MASPYTPYAVPSPNFSVTQTPNSESTSNAAIGTPTPTGRGRPRGGLSGAKRGRKPRGGGATSIGTPHSATGGASTPSFVNQQYAHVHWALPTGSSTQASTSAATDGADGAGSIPQGNTTTNTISAPTPEQQYQPQPAFQLQSQLPPPTPQQHISFPGQPSTPAAPSNTTNYAMPSTIPTLDTTGLISFASTNPPLVLPTGSTTPLPLPLPRPPPRPVGADEDGEGEDELLPAMADDDYSAQLSWQSQSKDNLKVLMDNFSAAQYDRFEAYRRHALPKQAVRKVIQQTLGQQVSQPVAQIVAGFAKVFVGEIVEKARAVQARRGDSGPLSPDHLREAYKMYQEETGRVGAARPLRSKRLFVR